MANLQNAFTVLIIIIIIPKYISTPVLFAKLSRNYKSPKLTTYRLMLFLH